mgnify:CR=1 FL=1
MTTATLIHDLLSAPLAPGWTVEALADTLLRAVASQATGAPDAVFTVDATTDAQSRRLIRPLLAHLATLSGGESGTPVNLYAGALSIRRSGGGPVWVVGEFENRPGSVRLALRSSGVPAASPRPAPPIESRFAPPTGSPV